MALNISVLGQAVNNTRPTAVKNVQLRFLFNSSLPSNCQRNCILRIAWRS